MMKPKVLILVGPTASGKKKLASEIARRFSGEIISVDSRKVYRYLDIGTAKPSLLDRTVIPYHLIDIIDPDKTFSAWDWVKQATSAIADIHSRGKVPILSGGTGFYLSAFTHGLTEGIEPTVEIRNNLKGELTRKGPAALYRMLLSIDPDRASQLNEHDTFRVIRALEVYYTTGRTFSSFQGKEKISGGDYTYLTFGLLIERRELYHLIDKRVDDMVTHGLIEEIKGLLERGYSQDIPGFDTVGYKEWFPYLNGVMGFKDCLEEVKKNTRHYAKRQLTWFNSRPEIQWIKGETLQSQENLFQQIEQWLVTERDEKT